MNFTTLRALLVVTLLCLSGAVLAAPGGPIGGIIVKGGKNPGGQMRALATTDARGAFSIVFAEGGDYRLAFDASSRKEFGDRMKAGLQVGYTLVPRTAGSEAKDQADSATRSPELRVQLESGAMVITVPRGGGELRGVLRAAPAATAADRAINENGISEAPSKPKRPVKK